MRKLCISFLALMSISTLYAKDIVMNTPNTSLVLKAEDGKPLYISYYGERINSVDEVYMAYSLWEHAYPAFGAGCQDVTALNVKHANGNMSTELVCIGNKELQESNSMLYTISMKDKLYDFYVDVCYRAYDNTDVIETWSEIRNEEKKPITLLKYASGFMPIRQGDVWLCHEHGAWGAEAQFTANPLVPGIYEIQDRNGVKNAVENRPNIMLSLDGKPQENSGRVMGAVLCWSGNYKMSIETQHKQLHRLVAGINEENSQYTLARGESLTTPELAFAYSNEGMGGVSRAYHRWARLNNKVHNGTALRKILLNSWEGVYLNVNHQGMVEMMDGVKMLGGELFVMDDGWFGRKYKRSIDDCALGDWDIDTEKLPNGVRVLEQAATERGLKWGIWIEPEMTNLNKSELYEKHPDWIICHPDRTPIPGRGGTQMVLDMSNPEVQDYVVNVVDKIMEETPNTYYIKWDANYEIRNFGSHYLDADKQSHLYVDYHLGLRKALERIRAKYPDLVIQACASGGGRVNYGLMPYFDEFWVSDNTDAKQRLFMQYGTSMFFPACAMAQHISASPNHQTGRRIPLKFRVDVAMTGRLGMEMKPSDLSSKEVEFVKNAFATYKELRPIIQQGDLYRLISPYEGKGYCSQMYVNETKSEAVFFAYKFEHYVDFARPRFYFAGLDPNATYTLTEANRDGRTDHWEGSSFSGRFLMQSGIEIRLDGEYASKVIRLKKK